MLQMENLKYQNASTSSSTPGNQGISQTTNPEIIGHSSSLQNVSGFSHDLVGSSVGQHVHSNTYANTQREMQGSQPSQLVAFQPQQRQQLSHQFLKQKAQKPSIHPSFMQPNIHYSHHDQQPQQILSQTNPLQSSQQLMLPTQQPRQLIGQQLNTTLLQQNHQFGQQNNFSEQQLQQSSFYLQNVPHSFQQSINPQSNVSGIQQQQKIVGSQSDVLNMQVHQHSANILQHPEANTAQKNIPWTSQQLQFHKLLGSQQKNNSLVESTPHRSQTSPALLQPQNVIDKQKLIKSQRLHPEASSVSMESTAHIENPNSVDWYDQAYQKIQSMKEKILPELSNAYNYVQSMYHNNLKALEPGVVEQLKNRILMLHKMIKFLQISRSEIVHIPRNKVVFNQQMIFNQWTSICKSHGSIQNQGPQLQVPGNQSLTQLQQQRNMKPSLSPMNLIPSTTAGTIPVLSTHQGVPNSQPNTTSSLQSSSQVGSEQRNALNPFHQTFMKHIPQNVVNVLQAPSSTSNNMLDHTMSSPQPSSVGATFPQLRQQQKHQIMQTQKLKPQMQQQWVHHKKQQMMQKMYEVSDGTVKPLIGTSSGVVQQHHSPSQSLDYPNQSLLSANSHQFHATSPQTSQHSCPQIDQQNFLSPLSKSATPLQSDASPFIVPSPSTPLTPSSVPVDLDKHPSGVLPLSVAENNGHPQTSVSVAQVQIQNQALTMGTPGISASPLLTELTSPDGNEQSHIMEQPLDRLLKAVESISPRALYASVYEIGSVGSMIDSIARAAGCNESRAAISLDLVANTKYHLQNLSGSPPKKMKRHITAVAFDDLSSSVSKVHNLKQLRGQISDIESTMNSRIKRPRIEPCKVLLKEIRDINRQQVEVVVEIISDSAEDVGTGGVSDGTIVRCSYNAVSLLENLNLECAASQILSIYPLWFHVPENYPSSSPTVLDKFPCEWSSNKKEHEDLSQKARLRFELSLRNLSQPMSLAEMAKTWEVCARAVYWEYAQLLGGECFTSRYGTWEDYVVAS